MRMKKPVFLAIILVALFTLQGGALALSSAASMPAGTRIKTYAPAYKRMLKLGSRGADVKALQQQLTILGYYKGTADGIFGRGTQACVKSFQKVNKLKADGVVGRTTFNAIFTASPSPDATPAPTATAVPGGTVAPTASPAPTAAYAFGKLDNQKTLRKGNTGNGVRDLQAALKMKGFYSGEINGKFQESTRSAVMSFQRSIGLKADGKAGNYTLSALYTMLNPPDLNSILPWPAGVDAGFGFTVEKLSWSTASSVLKRGMTATVVDVRSGFMFTIKRTGGTRHADVETLTPLDTATFYKCSGNRFSWTRRPIWVIVDGRRLAASMNCMPHGYDSIADNDFKGQFCIHFVGSRTHGSRRVDPDHRACIEEAYQAGLTMCSPTPSTSADATPGPSATGQLPPP